MSLKGKINRTLATLTVVLTLIPVFSSCEKDHGPSDEELAKTRRVMLLYSAGFNSLSSYLADDINDLKTGFVPDVNGNVLLIFSKQPKAASSYYTPTSPVLIRLYKDKHSNVVMDTVYRWEAGTIASSSKTLNKVLSYVQEHYKARSYGMVFSSHASGWLPEGYYTSPSSYERSTSSLMSIKRTGTITDPEGVPYVDEFLPGPAVKSIGMDKVWVDASNNFTSYEMTIKDFAAAIPMHMDYILFDACLMGGIETAYELRNVTDMVGFSQAEVLAEGFDYTKIATHLIGTDTSDPISVCSDYFDYYNAQKLENRSATISAVDCTKLDSLTEVCGYLFEKYRSQIKSEDYSKAQVYFRYNKHYFYDLLSILLTAGITTEEQAKLQSALDQCILYKGATPSFLGVFDITTYSGLSMYNPADSTAFLNGYYKANISWNDATSLVK